MIEILGFIFSGFWIWLGFVILVYAVAVSLGCVIKAVHSERKISIQRSEDGQQTVVIENAAGQDTADVISMTVGNIDLK